MQLFVVLPLPRPDSLGKAASDEAKPVTCFSCPRSSKPSFMVVGSISLAIIVGWVCPAHAYDLPSISLGLTSFLNGSLPSGPSLYYQNYSEIYSASRFADSHGKALPLPKQDFDIVADISQLTYYFPQTIGPGRLARDLVVPTVA